MRLDTDQTRSLSHIYIYITYTESRTDSAAESVSALPSVAREGAVETHDRPRPEIIRHIKRCNPDAVYSAPYNLHCFLERHSICQAY